jgi:hypothetical protein
MTGKKTGKWIMAAAALCVCMAGGAVSVGLSVGRGEAEAAEASRPIDVYLIGGQSNAVGYGYDDLAAGGYTDGRFEGGFENVLFYGNYESQAATPSDFISVKKGRGKVWTDGTAGSGAEIGIASALGDLPGTHAVIKCAWGATYLAPDTAASVSGTQGTWTSPGYIAEQGIRTSGTLIGNMYARFLTSVRIGLDKLTQKGYAPLIKGMWWMQGEAESENAAYAAAYEKLIGCLIADVRADLSELTGERLSAMPFVIGKIYRNPAASQMPYIDTVRQAQQNAADKISNVYTVDCHGLRQQDGWHYYASAQVYLGRKFIEAVQLGAGKRQVACEGDTVTAAGMGMKAAGESLTVTFTPTRGYRLISVEWQIGSGERTELTLKDGSYTFTMPDEDVRFYPETAALPLYKLAAYSCSDEKMGAVYPSAAAKKGWYEGESVSIAVVANEGYRIKAATVNGRTVDAADTTADAVYYSIRDAADVTFYVEFEADSAPPPSGDGDEPGCGQVLAGTAAAVSAVPLLAAVLAVSGVKRRKKR